MSPVVHLRKVLVGPPAAVRDVAGVEIRTWRPGEDIEAWLTLRDRSVGRLRPAPRSWTPADFRREMSDKPWWRDAWTWLAVARAEPGRLVGAVTLAVRTAAGAGPPESRSKPVVHWLLVEPGWRRRGTGRRLMTHLEQAVWEVGWREVGVETHANWREAIAFYEALGYRGESVEGWRRQSNG